MKLDGNPTPHEALEKAATATHEAHPDLLSAIDLLMRNCHAWPDVTTPGPAAALALQLRATHRTTQQLFWATILEVLKDYATNDTGEDGRNAASKEWARRVLEIDIQGFPYV